MTSGSSDSGSANMAANMEDAGFMKRFLEKHPISHNDKEYFGASWLGKYLQDPAYTSIPTFSRVLKPSGEDYFFSTTINTSKTIANQITLILNDLKTPESSTEPETPANQRSHRAVTKVPDQPDNLMLLHLGTPGMDGHPKTMHGGMLCAILDETMGLNVLLHHSKALKEARESIYTVELKTTYRAAVPTPSDVLVRCWLARRDGRKWYSRGQIVDQDGVVMTEAEGVWVSTKRKTDEKL